MLSVVRALGLSLVLFAAPALLAAAEPRAIQIIVLTPDLADQQPAEIFMSSSLLDWRERGEPLARVAPGLYSGTVKAEPGAKVEYKFTRTGQWATVEKSASGQELQNRVLLVDGALAEQVAVHRVARWADRAPGAKRRIDLAGEIGSGPTSAPTAEPTLTGAFRYHRNFHSSRLKQDRTIIVYLPPGYDDHPDQRYPVLYMHDGNNIFDAATSFNGEWQADETAQKLIESGKLPPLIIVGIYNTSDRMREYTPVPDKARGGGEGDAYIDCIIQELKPLIDKTYRTRPERAATGIAGSSLGGLISLYAAFAHPDVFGMAGVLSPTVVWANRAVLKFVKDHPANPRPRLWIDIGADEGRTAPDVLTPHQEACRELVSILENAGYRPGRDYYYEEVANAAAHNEAAWAARFDRVLLYLYGSESKDVSSQPAK